MRKYGMPIMMFSPVANLMHHPLIVLTRGIGNGPLFKHFIFFWIGVYLPPGFSDFLRSCYIVLCKVMPLVTKI